MPPTSTINEQPLPEDVAVLQAMIRELLASNREQCQRLDSLQARLDQLLRRLYGPRAERIDPAQLNLFAATEPTSNTTTEPASPATPELPRKRKGHGRQQLPKHLSRQRIVHELSEAERLCPCCHKPRQAVSSQTSEQLDYQPASLFIVEHVRLTYVCSSCQGGVSSPVAATPEDQDAANTSTFVTAPKPAQPIERGMAGPGLLAYVILSKYGDHLPLYRLEGIFGRHGVQLSRKTLCDWMAACAELFRPLTKRMGERLRAGRVIWADDTTMPFIERGHGSTRQGSLWAYYGDWSARYVVYDFTPGRLQSGPLEFLKGFRGYLQADAYNGYDALYKSGDIIEVACWAHARRKFYEARDSDSERAHRMLAWIRQLYAVEAKAAKQVQERGLDLSVEWQLRKQLRQAEALPVLTAIRQWLDAEKDQVLPKSPLGEAIGYLLNSWEAFTRYPSEGFLHPDNNVAERSLRPLTVGRANYLFVGSEAGGQTAAVLYSLTQSCRRLGLNTFEYLRDLLTSWPEVAEADRDSWLPDEWAERQREQATGPPGESNTSSQG